MSIGLPGTCPSATLPTNSAAAAVTHILKHAGVCAITTSLQFRPTHFPPPSLDVSPLRKVPGFSLPPETDPSQVPLFRLWRRSARRPALLLGKFFQLGQRIHTHI